MDDFLNVLWKMCNYLKVLAQNKVQIEELKIKTKQNWLQLTLQNWTNTQHSTFKCCSKIQFHKNFNGQFSLKSLILYFQKKIKFKTNNTWKVMFGLKWKKHTVVFYNHTKEWDAGSIYPMTFGYHSNHFNKLESYNSFELTSHYSLIL